MTDYLVFRGPMDVEPNDIDNDLQRLLEKEKLARVNNDHPTSVVILKDIVSQALPRSPSATRLSSGTPSTSRSPS